MKKYLVPFALVTSMAFTTSAFAADEFSVDPEHTWVNFSVNHGGFSTAQGNFGEVAGTILFDQDDVTKSSVSVEIKTASITTNHEARDGHLASPDFFNVAEFPTVTFESTAIEKTGDNTGSVTGDLTMIGVTKEITLDAVFNKLEGDKVGFSATAEITPDDFGMSKVAGFGMGPNVMVSINLEALK